MRLKLDENLGRSAVDLLRQAGHDIGSVIDEGLQGTPDRLLIETCRAERRCLVTLDLEFGNPILFPPADFAGIAVLTRIASPRERSPARWKRSSRGWNPSRSRASSGSFSPAGFVVTSLRTAEPATAP